MHRETAEPFAGAVETHSGAVFFVGDKAYKMKKPVRFGFLDFTRAEDRRLACVQEVESNSRLAPDVYLGVADVIAPDGSTCDYLVVMRRLPDDRRLSVLAAQGAPVEEHLQRIAEALSDFHEAARRSAEIDSFATAALMLERWEASHREMATMETRVVEPEVGARAHHLARRYLAGREALFSARAAAGRVCDGHGDLLADDIFCLDDGPRILDCVEFDERLRYVDVLGDVASLAMDLERVGRPDLGRSFLDRYRSVSGDDWPDSLAHHYMAYRAQVRAMVAGLRYQQGRWDSADEMRLLLSLSARHLEDGRVRVVVVGGLPGTGKSTLAQELAAALHGVWIRSDEVRKRLAGIDPSTPAGAGIGEGIYSPSATRATYSAMIEQARSQLLLGRSVVLDATFTEARWRAAVRELSDQAHADLDELRCVAPIQLIEDRLDERAASLGVSDATVEVAHHMAGSEVLWPTATDVDTTGSFTETLATVLRRLGVADPSSPP
jgi:aminoglycoside phosphotransferase family enzyme/predicted kinase